MAQVKNVSPFGDLEVPAIGAEVLFGEVLECSDDVAASLLEQPLHWESVDVKASKATTTPQNEETN